MHLDVENLILLLRSDYATRLKYLAELKLGATWTIGPFPHLKLAGTKVFMPIGGLLGEPQSFMHDLESIFWVLFWICIHHEGFDKKGKVKRRIVPEYEKWNCADTEELAKIKAGQISKGIFDYVDENFTKHCKPLVPCMRELHKVVFPGGSRWFTEHRELYSDMKRILEKARNRIDVKAI